MEDRGVDHEDLPPPLQRAAVLLEMGKSRGSGRRRSKTDVDHDDRDVLAASTVASHNALAAAEREMIRKDPQEVEEEPIAYKKEIASGFTFTRTSGRSESRQEQGHRMRAVRGDGASGSGSAAREGDEKLDEKVIFDPVVVDVSARECRIVSPIYERAGRFKVHTRAVNELSWLSVMVKDKENKDKLVKKKFQDEDEDLMRIVGDMQVDASASSFSSITSTFSSVDNKLRGRAGAGAVDTRTAGTSGTTTRTSGGFNGEVLHDGVEKASAAIEIPQARREKQNAEERQPSTSTKGDAANAPSPTCAPNDKKMSVAPSWPRQLAARQLCTSAGVGSSGSSESAFEGDSGDENVEKGSDAFSLLHEMDRESGKRLNPVEALARSLELWLPSDYMWFGDEKLQRRDWRDEFDVGAALSVAVVDGHRYRTRGGDPVPCRTPFQVDCNVNNGANQAGQSVTASAFCPAECPYVQSDLYFPCLLSCVAKEECAVLSYARHTTPVGARNRERVYGDNETFFCVPCGIHGCQDCPLVTLKKTTDATASPCADSSSAGSSSSCSSEVNSSAFADAPPANGTIGSTTNYIDHRFDPRGRSILSDPGDPDVLQYRVCEQCLPGYELTTLFGCVYNARISFQLQFCAILALLTLLLLFAFGLCKTPSNENHAEHVEIGLQHRGRAFYHPPDSPNTYYGWWATRVHADPSVGGVGFALYFNSQFGLLLYTLVAFGVVYTFLSDHSSVLLMTQIRLSCEYYSSAFLGWRTKELKCEYADRASKVCWTLCAWTALYVIGLEGYQRRAAGKFLEQNPSMPHYVLRLQGFPADATDPSEIQAWLELEILKFLHKDEPAEYVRELLLQRIRLFEGAFRNHEQHAEMIRADIPVKICYVSIAYDIFSVEQSSKERSGLLKDLLEKHVIVNDCDYGVYPLERVYGSKRVCPIDAGFYSEVDPEGARRRVAMLKQWDERCMIARGRMDHDSLFFDPLVPGAGAGAGAGGGAPAGEEIELPQRAGGGPQPMPGKRKTQEVAHPSTTGIVFTEQEEDAARGQAHEDHVLSSSGTREQAMLGPDVGRGSDADRSVSDISRVAGTSADVNAVSAGARGQLLPPEERPPPPPRGRDVSRDTSSSEDDADDEEEEEEYPDDLEGVNLQGQEREQLSRGRAPQGEGEATVTGAASLVETGEDEAIGESEAMPPQGPAGGRDAEPASTAAAQTLDLGVEEEWIIEEMKRILLYGDDAERLDPILDENMQDARAAVASLKSSGDVYVVVRSPQDLRNLASLFHKPPKRKRRRGEARGQGDSSSDSDQNSSDNEDKEAEAAKAKSKSSQDDEHQHEPPATATSDGPRRPRRGPRRSRCCRCRCRCCKCLQCWKRRQHRLKKWEKGLLWKDGQSMIKAQPVTDLPTGILWQNAGITTSERLVRIIFWSMILVGFFAASAFANVLCRGNLAVSRKVGPEVFGVFGAPQGEGEATVTGAASLVETGEDEAIGESEAMPPQGPAGGRDAEPASTAAAQTLDLGVEEEWIIEEMKRILLYGDDAERLDPILDENMQDARAAVASLKSSGDVYVVVRSPQDLRNLASLFHKPPKRKRRRGEARGQGDSSSDSDQNSSDNEDKEAEAAKAKSKSSQDDEHQHEPPATATSDGPRRPRRGPRRSRCCRCRCRCCKCLQCWKRRQHRLKKWEKGLLWKDGQSMIKAQPVTDLPTGILWQNAGITTSERLVRIIFWSMILVGFFAASAFANVLCRGNLAVSRKVGPAGQISSAYVLWVAYSKDYFKAHGQEPDMDVGIWLGLYLCNIGGVCLVCIQLLSRTVSKNMRLMSEDTRIAVDQLLNASFVVPFTLLYYSMVMPPGTISDDEISWTKEHDYGFGYTRVWDGGREADAMAEQA
eukprot:g3673.t1